MRTAIVHYWLLNHRGGEVVLEALCRMFPEADLFTLFYDPARVSPAIRARRIHASFLNPLRRWHRSLLPLMPLALEQFDLSGYDLVISSESGPAKGVLAPAGARHICYCHSPMRYLWELYPAYIREWTPSWKRPMMAVLANYLRLWDFSTAQRVDDFVANSRSVAQRIWRAYRRTSRVIHPPVAVETFFWKPHDEYFLIVAELLPYKRIDSAVRVFSKTGARTGRKLRIVGAGPEYSNLKKLAAPNIEFCGRVTDEELRDSYARCRALLMPGEEEFGIVAVEALASGKPVIAFARGGALDIVPSDPVGGVLYEEAGDQQLEQALERFEQIEALIDPSTLRRHAAAFSEAEFRAKMIEVLQSPCVAAAEHGRHGS
ncbi:MAG TPA: glycosyltransferase [Bryobacteraceae bacterium]